MRRIWLSFLLIFFACYGFSVFGQAVSPLGDSQADYTSCMLRTNADPVFGLEQSTAWLAASELGSEEFLAAVLCQAFGFQALDQPREAAEAYQRYIDYVPYQPTAYIDMAIAYRELGELSKAQEALLIAQKLDLELLLPKILLANIRRLQGHPYEALRSLDAVIIADPTNASAFLERGILFRTLGRLEDAHSDWQMVMRLAPETAEAEIANANLQNLLE